MVHVHGRSAKKPTGWANNYFTVKGDGFAHVFLFRSDDPAEVSVALGRATDTAFELKGAELVVWRREGVPGLSTSVLEVGEMRKPPSVLEVVGEAAE